MSASALTNSGVASIGTGSPTTPMRAPTLIATMTGPVIGSPCASTRSGSSMKGCRVEMCCATSVIVRASLMPSSRTVTSMSASNSGRGPNAAGTVLPSGSIIFDSSTPSTGLRHAELILRALAGEAGLVADGLALRLRQRGDERCLRAHALVHGELLARDSWRRCGPARRRPAASRAGSARTSSGRRPGRRPRTRRARRRESA